LTGFLDLRDELEGIALRAQEARLKLAIGEATTGATALVDIENRCRDALAAAADLVAVRPSGPGDRART
jgi:hypothetical protein